MPSIINATLTNGLVTSADNSGSLQLQTNNGTTAVTIDTSQNVGIGTSSPATPLSVVRASSVSIQASTGTVDFRVQSIDSGSAAYVGTISNHACLFTTNNTERMRIDSAGDLLIGTTSDPWGVSTGLVVSSGGHAAYMRSTASAGFAVLTLERSGASAGDQMYFRTTSGLAGIISSSGTNTTYGTSSDYRLKEDVEPMSDALQTISKLKPVTYKWKVDGSKGQGFIAHELQEVCPDAVVGKKDDVDEKGNIKPQNIDTSYLVATLTAAIQEQQAQIEELKAEVQALKGAA